jgi:hypothetical protein
MVPAKDKRIVSDEHRTAVLRWLYRFGWLLARQLAALEWQGASQACTMARRTLVSMESDRLVVRRKLPGIGLDAWTLSAKGATRLGLELGIKVESGARLALGNPVHRTATNDYLIDQHLDGNRIHTEHEIQTGRSSLVQVYGKTADGGVETGYGLLWVETENAWKNRRERGRITQFCADVLSGLERMEPAGEGLYLFGVNIIATNEDAMRAIERSFAEAYQRGFISELALTRVRLLFIPLGPSLSQSDSHPIERQIWECVEALLV